MNSWNVQLEQDATTFTNEAVKVSLAVGFADLLFTYTSLYLAATINTLRQSSHVLRQSSHVSDSLRARRKRN